MALAKAEPPRVQMAVHDQLLVWAQRRMQWMDYELTGATVQHTHTVDPPPPHPPALRTQESPNCRSTRTRSRQPFAAIVSARCKQSCAAGLHPPEQCAFYRTARVGSSPAAPHTGSQAKPTRPVRAWVRRRS